MKNTITKLTVIRHGETEWNKIGLQQGHLDSPLTEIGIKQAQAVTGKLSNEKIDVIYSSDLGRAMRTAEIIADELDLKIIPDKNLRERNLGILQGITKKEFAEKCPEEYSKFLSGDPNYQFPNGESARQRYDRNIKGIIDIVSNHKGQNILIVSHGGVLNSLIRYVLNIPLENKRCFSLFNLSVNRFTIKNGKWSLDTWGDISHLNNIQTLDDN